MGNAIQVIGQLAVAKKTKGKHSHRSRTRDPDPHRVTIFDEEPQSFARFRTQIITALAPTDAVEHLLAGRIAACAWRLRRVYRIESGLYAKARSSWQEGILTITPEIALVFLRLAAEDDLAKLQRYEAGLERALYRAVGEFRRWRSWKRTAPRTLRTSYEGPRPSCITKTI